MPVLRGLSVALHSFDVPLIGYIAPVVIRDWRVSRSAHGPVFGAGLFGILLGPPKSSPNRGKPITLSSVRTPASII